MAARVEFTQQNYAKYLEESPWSDDALGAPWWIQEDTQFRMQTFAKDLLFESSCSPDMAVLNGFNEQYIFVYGTLKKGFAAHDLLDDARYVGKGWTLLSKFKMVMGDFPVAMFETNEAIGKSIQGEVYLVPNPHIKYIDKFEGNGSMYRRRRMAVKMENDKTKVCWMYLGIPSCFTALTKLAPVYARKKGGLEYYSFTKGKK